MSDRVELLRARLEELGIDALVAGPSADYRWLTGLEPPIATRLTLAILPRSGPLVVVTPAFEAPGETTAELVTWLDGEDAAAVAAEVLGRSEPRTIAVTDRTWARYVLPLQAALPDARFVPGGPAIEPLRSIKDASEQAALRAAGAAVDRTLAGVAELPFAGRTEREVGRAIAELLASCGHDEVHEVIVGSGPQGALPHAHPSDRVIGRGDAVVVDIGGAVAGYTSDVTRMFVVGERPPGYDAVHAAVEAAHQAGRAAATVGATTGSVDAAARAVLEAAGLGERFTHRLGHGIGLDVHEAPYLAPGSETVLAEGMAFSIEPGAYLPGRFGVRIEDIVILGANGAEPVTTFPHDPHVV